MAGLTTNLRVHRLVLRHGRTPLLAKVLLALAVGYLLLPFDLIPDFLPVIGHLDDVVLVSLLVFIALRMVPRRVVEECKEKVKRRRREATESACGSASAAGAHRRVGGHGAIS